MQAGTELHVGRIVTERVRRLGLLGGTLVLKRHVKLFDRQLKLLFEADVLLGRIEIFICHHVGGRHGASLDGCERLHEHLSRLCLACLSTQLAELFCEER